MIRILRIQIRHRIIPITIQLGVCQRELNQMYHGRLEGDVDELPRVGGQEAPGRHHGRGEVERHFRHGLPPRTREPYLWNNNKEVSVTINFPSLIRIKLLFNVLYGSDVVPRSNQPFNEL